MWWSSGVEFTSFSKCLTLTTRHWMQWWCLLKWLLKIPKFAAQLSILCINEVFWWSSTKICSYSSLDVLLIQETLIFLFFSAWREISTLIPLMVHKAFATPSLRVERGDFFSVGVRATGSKRKAIKAKVDWSQRWVGFFQTWSNISQELLPNSHQQSPHRGE